MARFIFSKPQKQYKDCVKYLPWLEENSYPAFCGYSWLIDQPLMVDHYKPRDHYRELTSNPDNLIPCTDRCNKAKSDYHPEAKNRRVYKEEQSEIYNYRYEDIAKYVEVKSNGCVSHKLPSHKKRFDFNSKIFRLHDSRFREIRKEYLDTLEELKTLNKIYESLISSKNKSDNKYLKQVKKLFEMRRKACSRRYVFYKLFNIKIPKQIEKLLTNKSVAKFSSQSCKKNLIF